MKCLFGHIYIWKIGSNHKGLCIYASRNKGPIFAYSRAGKDLGLMTRRHAKVFQRRRNEGNSVD